MLLLSSKRCEFFFFFNIGDGRVERRAGYGSVPLLSLLAVSYGEAREGDSSLSVCAIGYGVVPRSPPSAMVKLAQEIEESHFDAVVNGMVLHLYESAVVISRRRMKSRASVPAVTAWCPLSP